MLRAYTYQLFKMVVSIAVCGLNGWVLYYNLTTLTGSERIAWGIATLLIIIAFLAQFIYSLIEAIVLAKDIKERLGE